MHLCDTDFCSGGDSCLTDRPLNPIPDRIIGSSLTNIASYFPYIFPFNRSAASSTEAEVAAASSTEAEAAAPAAVEGSREERMPFQTIRKD